MASSHDVSKPHDFFGCLKKLAFILALLTIAINVTTTRRLHVQFEADMLSDLAILRHIRGLDAKSTEDDELGEEDRALRGAAAARPPNKVLNILQLVERVEKTLTSPLTKDRIVVLGKSFIMKRDYDIWDMTFGEKGYEVVKTDKLHLQQLEKADGLEWEAMLCLDLFDGRTHCIEPTALPALKPWQKISRLYGLRKILWNKDKFCETMSQSLKGFDNNYTEFVFPCWLLPADYDDLIAEAKTKYSGKSFILKPTDRGEGNGIIVMDSYKKLPNWKADFQDIDEVVVQTYLPNPFLINGRKWDMRTYVLVTSIHPLRVYMYRDGLVRFASSKYVADAKDGGKKTAFLTNTSVNKKAGVAVDDLTWPFPQVYAYLKSIGVNPDLLWSNIERAVVQVLLSAEAAFLRRFKALRTDFTCANCYQLLGVDVIVDDDLIPRVIEVNGEPSMQLTGETGSHYDHTKRGMARDLANLIYGKESYSRAVTADLFELELEGFNIGYAALGCNADDEICLNSGDINYILDFKKEETMMGGFRRMYPSKNMAYYKDFIQHLEAKLPYGTTTSTWRLYKLLSKMVERSETNSENSIEDNSFDLHGSRSKNQDEDEEVDD